MGLYAWLVLRQLINFPVVLFIFMAGYFVNTDKVELSTRAYALNRGATVSTVFGMEQCGSVYIVKDWLITGEVSLKHMLTRFAMQHGDWITMSIL